MMQLTTQLLHIWLVGSTALGAVDTSIQIRDVHGTALRPFKTELEAVVLFFLSTDCPISRFYAQEIQRTCRAYAGRVSCRLIFEDVPLQPATVNKHLEEFGYRGIPAAIDNTGSIALHTKTLVTPTAVVVDKSGSIRYRGRIDNFYSDLGAPRRQATVHDLKDALQAVTTGRPVPHPETKPIGCLVTSPAVLKQIQDEGGR